MNRDQQPVFLTGFAAQVLPYVLIACGIAGLVFTFFLGKQAPKDAWYSYLFSATFYISISLGAMFFVLIQFITRAGWSVTVRRVAEQLMANVGIMALLFIPILFGIDYIFAWANPEVIATDPLIQSKTPYLNKGFFIGRLIFYFIVWGVYAFYFYSRSLAQDRDGDPELTLRLQKASPSAILFFAITVTFASFDWLMSLDAHWYSTIFGVYFFSGSVIVSLAVMILFFVWFQTMGKLKNEVTLEHFHDLGKLMWGFNVFWAYIAFSQYFLIWYANIPEETLFFNHRSEGNWMSLSLILVFGHFVIPFWLFMSRHMKRNLISLSLFAVWMIVMQIVDLFWLIMPNLDHHHVPFSAVTVASFIGIGGIFFGFLLLRMRSKSLLAYKDPRLGESLHFHNF